MSVLTCVTRGPRLPRPLRLLPEGPTRPECDVRKCPDTVGDPDGQGFMVTAGPRDTSVVHPEDPRGRLRAVPASQEIGCCGEPGRAA
ncbi:hypothetical protein RKE30_26205 [Streptomyces sp. Li-HN-5-11]|uniref:hypothetical protein n=1 Tax=Streptomyces sp. Li-HN-5-11 TaxID=3075432 RepID=UPI0028AD14AB|nr:hypothetical protein [Streptomyces sp. Li-HN-5-11]WNM33631.1 hypothetical protein RKE30_26205 [Streptomyces sp. Li-HN-5-11]